MSLVNYKVIDVTTKQVIDMVYGFDRESVLKKVERNMPDYKEYFNVETVSLVQATPEEVSDYARARREAINVVYTTAGTAD